MSLSAERISVSAALGERNVDNAVGIALPAESRRTCIRPISGEHLKVVSSACPSRT